MEEDAITNSEIVADEYGDWLAEIDTSNIEQGMHTVVVEDEYGNSETCLLYVQKADFADWFSSSWWLLIVLVLAMYGAYKVAKTKYQRNK